MHSRLAGDTGQGEIAALIRARDAVERDAEPDEVLPLLQEAADLLKLRRIDGDMSRCRDLLAPTLKSLLPVNPRD